MAGLENRARRAARRCSESCTASTRSTTVPPVRPRGDCLPTVPCRGCGRPTGRGSATSSSAGAKSGVGRNSEAAFRHLLTTGAEETPPAAFTMHASVDLSSAVRTRAAPVDFQILPQREDSSELQKAHRKYAGVSDNRAQLPIRNSSGVLKRARPGAEEHFVFDDVSHAGEDRLVQQDIGDFLARKGTDLPKGG